ncbi:MAG: hypothetical protein IKQ59_15200 [Prevotella sp.]|nr:hypothetical protein [Prevotella sp.]
MDKLKKKHASERIEQLAFCLLSIVFSFHPLWGFAQSEAQYRYQDATQLWRLTDNAAGLGLDNSENRGYAEFGLEHRSGDYHRVQEGGQRNQLTFETERYQHIGSFLVGYGHFLFDMDRTKDRAWADVMRPYDSNPFYSGSSVHGKYDQQLFDLTAAISTIPIPLVGENVDRELTLGARLDYKVGDLSRLRDPRSRSELLDYKIAPGVTYSFGNNTVGLSGYYRRRKEKIPSMTTVQTDPNLLYYQFYGLGEATGTVGGYSGYQREWVNHQFGAELTYGLNLNPQFSTLNSIDISRGAEDVWGQYKFSPGRYTSYIYKAASRNRFGKGRLLHAIDLEAEWQQGYADEYRQQLIQEKDPEKGYTSYRYETQITYRKRQQLTTFDACLHYRLNIVGHASQRGNLVGHASQRDNLEETGTQGSVPHYVATYVGAKAQLSGSTNKHLLPSSELKHNRLNLSLEGGHGLLKGRLWIDATATYSNATKADLSLADATTEVAQQVLLPDMLYYDANYFRGQLSVKYLFPLKLKGYRSTFYVKAYGDLISAQHSLDRKTVGLTFGLYN